MPNMATMTECLGETTKTYFFNNQKHKHQLGAIQSWITHDTRHMSPIHRFYSPFPHLTWVSGDIFMHHWTYVVFHNDLLLIYTWLLHTSFHIPHLSDSYINLSENTQSFLEPGLLIMIHEHVTQLVRLQLLRLCLFLILCVISYLYFSSWPVRLFQLAL